MTIRVFAAAPVACSRTPAVRAHRPDVAIVDIRMPPTHTDEGLRAALAIRSELPATAVLVLSSYVEEQYALDLLSDSAAGVGYLLRIGSPTSTDSWTRSDGSRRVARRSIPRSYRRCSGADAPPIHSRS